MGDKPVVILGAGPAGLTAAYELVQHGMKPIIMEKLDDVGGLARTVHYKDYHFDIGGHRFFTKIEEVSRLWNRLLGDDLRSVNRISRIYYQGRFFEYPLRAFDTFVKLGPVESALILFSYLWVRVRPLRHEDTFEHWVSNRFGRRLYRTFFKTYTEKVWGIPCDRIGSDWAVQRIKGLSLVSAVCNALFGMQKAKSLISRFDYPIQGPGMIWQVMSKEIEAGGGEVRLNTEPLRLKHAGGVVRQLICSDGTQEVEISPGEVVSSIPITRLLSIMEPKVPDRVLDASQKLSFRAFIIVVIIIDKKDVFPDQWIYIHSPEVRVGRIQNFKNWSAAMVPDSAYTSLGMEYFCVEGDPLWTTPDADLVELAKGELSELGFGESTDLVDSHVYRQPHAYPIYDQGYRSSLEEIAGYLGTFKNLQTMGRSGLYRYNNMDHSMHMGMLAARNLLGGNYDLWEEKEGQEYFEEDKDGVQTDRLPVKALLRTFDRMDKLALATAVGSVAGLLAFLATVILLIKGGETVGPNLQLLSQYFVGYTVTLKGSVIAFAYSFGWGFMLGWLFAYLRNLFLAFYIYRTKKKAELLSFKDFIDNF